MSIESFREFLETLTLKQLREGRRLLEEQISRLSREGGGTAVIPGDRRSHRRFAVQLNSTARPLGGEFSGERRFPVTIVDLSASGMRFILDSTAPAWPLMEVSFTGPGGKPRCVYVRLVRVRAIEPAEGTVRPRFEISARAITEAELAEARRRQDRLMAAGKHCRSRHKLPVLLVGAGGALLESARRGLSALGHPVHEVVEIHRVESLVISEGIRAVLYLQSQVPMLHRDIVERLRQRHADLAQVSVISGNESRQAALEAGMDDCVHAVNVESLLGTYVERAIRSRLMDENDEGDGIVRVLISAEQNLALAQAGAQCSRPNFQVSFSYDMEGTLGMLRCTEVDALVLDGGIAKQNGWRAMESVRREFPGLPVIVAVESLAEGPAALAHGGTEYLTLPATRNELVQMVTSARRAMEQESVMRFQAATAG